MTTLENRPNTALLVVDVQCRLRRRLLTFTADRVT
jgi:hypothetical protein